MRKTVIIFALVICICLPVFAAQPPVWDGAELLSFEESSKLNEIAMKIRESYECDVIVYTVDDFEGSDVVEAAEDAFLNAGYGIGEDLSGIMLYISMAERDFVILAHGYGNDVFTDSGKAYLENAFLPYLSDGDYYQAFYTFIDECAYMLADHESGGPVYAGKAEYEEYPNEYEESDSKFNIPILLIVPTVIAGIVVLIMKSSMKSAKMQAAANAYIPAGGFDLTGRSDIFTHRTVRRVKRPDPPKSSGGGGRTTIRSGGFSSRSGKF